MDYDEFLLALALISEERYGRRLREYERAESAQMQQSMKQQVSHARNRG